MEVILQENIRNLGQLGDKVDVAAGYGRNYLLPKGLAVPANAINLAEFEVRRAELEKAAAARLQAAQDRAAQLTALPQVTIAARSADEGKLYGSIDVRQIAEAITAAGTAVEKSEVTLPTGPIRNVGEYSITLQLHTDVDATIKILVVEAE